jgi:O-antigen/teichoic acid export membrane protein
VTADFALSRLRAAATLHRRGFVRLVARTAGFNFVSTAAGGLGLIIIARAVGPTARGEYAAVTSWFSVLWIIGGIGQPAALSYYVAQDPLRAREYVATSRAMMLVTGTVALVAGILLAPVLAHGLPSVTAAYRIAFGSSIVAFVGASFTSSLQGRDVRRWNTVSVTQPVFSLIAIVILWRLRRLTLDVTLVVTAVTIMLQLVCAYQSCRRAGLAPGRARAVLIRPLVAYGAAQIAAMAPAALNADLDQLVLSQTVSAADLGRYAVAVSVSMLPVPLVGAIGNVAFPRLAAQHGVTDATRRLQRLSVLASIGLAAAMLIPLAVVSYWLVPLVFGSAYRSAVPLLWILTPGSVFLASGQVTGDLLRGRHHPTVVAWGQLVGLISTVILLLALLPLFGVYGAAIATTVSYGVAFAVMLRRLSRLPAHSGGNRRHSRRSATSRRKARVYAGIVPSRRDPPGPPTHQQGKSPMPLEVKAVPNGGRHRKSG